MRPRTFEEFVGQTHVVGPGAALTKLVAGGNLPSIILWGPAGTGKTTLAHLLADAVGADMMRLSAVSSGVADARKVKGNTTPGLSATDLSGGDSGGGTCPTGYCHLGGPAISDKDAYGAGIVNAAAAVKR
jgi:hypothetical protein